MDFEEICGEEEEEGESDKGGIRKSMAGGDMVVLG